MRYRIISMNGIDPGILEWYLLLCRNYQYLAASSPTNSCKIGSLRLGWGFHQIYGGVFLPTKGILNLKMMIFEAASSLLRGLCLRSQAFVYLWIFLQITASFCTWIASTKSGQVIIFQQPRKPIKYVSEETSIEYYSKLCFGMTSRNVTHKFSTFYDFLSSTLFQTKNTSLHFFWKKTSRISVHQKKWKPSEVEILKIHLQADSFLSSFGGYFDLKLPSNIGGNQLGDVAVIHPRSIDTRMYIYIYRDYK